MNYIFDEIDSADYELIVTDATPSNVPERDVTEYVIPGRHGSLYVDNGRFKNIEVTYSITAKKMVLIDQYLARIKSRVGYHKLEDSLHPDSYRIAILRQKMEPAYINAEVSRQKISFICKPNRFLKTGDIQQSFTEAGGILENPTEYAAKPEIEVTGAGTVTISIGADSFTLTGMNGTVIVDCENMNVYSGTQNKNNIFSGKFPEIKPGQNVVEISAAGFDVKIRPRWWTV